MKIYMASSWRNERQPEVVRRLSVAGHRVYDFRHPRPWYQGFHWSEIHHHWKCWTPAEYRDALDHPVAVRGFGFDFEAMEECDVCVLLLPCGRSAHLEAGWCKGMGKGLAILLDSQVEPELMYKLADVICLDLQELLMWLEKSER